MDRPGDDIRGTDAAGYLEYRDTVAADAEASGKLVRFVQQSGKVA